VLLSIAFFSNLPYKALSKRKKKRTAEAFTGWIGSLQTALVTIFFNIYIIWCCRQISEKRKRIEDN
jgi:hypothetical protein